MAISTRKQGNAVYLSYSYRDGDRHVNIYCGKKGNQTTEEKLKAAKRLHFEAKLRRMQDRFDAQ